MVRMSVPEGAAPEGGGFADRRSRSRSLRRRPEDDPALSEGVV